MLSKEITIHNTVPVYKLNESKLSDIDKDESNEKGRRYLGQPDMVMLDDNRTLITVYPVGHGHGKLVMKVSEDAGDLDGKDGYSVFLGKITGNTDDLQTASGEWNDEADADHRSAKLGIRGGRCEWSHRRMEYFLFR